MGKINSKTKIKAVMAGLATAAIAAGCPAAAIISEKVRMKPLQSQTLETQINNDINEITPSLKGEIVNSQATIDGETVYFDSSNTPIGNFCNSKTNVVINGVTYDKASVTSLTFGNEYSAVTKIGDNFVAYFKLLTSIDFSGLINVSSIADGWLRGSTYLQTVDFSGLSNLVEVADSWLRDCAAIETIDFSALSNLIEVGSYWLSNCAHLNTINFSGLSNLATVGSSWLRQNLYLSSVDFSDLSQLSIVGDNFLRECALVNSITIGSLKWSEGFSTKNFALSTGTSGGTIYADEYKTAKSWLLGGLSGWNTDPAYTSTSYAVLNRTTTIYFSNDDTPISNFCDKENPTVTINGTEYDKRLITSLTFGEEYGSVTEVGGCWLAGFSGLNSVDFSGMSSLTTVGDAWLDGTTANGYANLSSINFNGLSSLSYVGTGWMNGPDGGFSSLTSLDFSGLISLNYVGSNWMYGADTQRGDNYGFINMSSITVGDVNLKNIGSGDSFTTFCFYWPNSGAIYGSEASSWLQGGIINWTLIDSFITSANDPSKPIYFSQADTPIDNFCGQFDSTSSISINGSSILVNDICSIKYGTSYWNVRSVGNYWLQGYGANSFSSLKSIDFSGLSSLSSVGANWLHVSSTGTSSFASLSSINFNGLSSLATVSNYWLCGQGASSFASLKSIDFSGLTSLRAVSTYWLNGEGAFAFASLSSINFNGLKSLKTISNYFLVGGVSSHSSLTSLDFSGLMNVTSIGEAWLYAAHYSFVNLSSINFSGMDNLSSVGNNWIFGNNYSFSSLNSINFSGLSSLQIVGNNWLCAYTGRSNSFNSLTSLDFSGLTNLSTVGNGWLYGASANCFSSLTSIDFSGFAYLSSVGDNWLNGSGVNSFLSLSSITVGEAPFPTSYGSNFAGGTVAAKGTNGTIYGVTARAWNVEGLSSWNTSGGK